MAYDSKKLGLLAFSGGFKLYRYVTDDTAATVDTAGYFNAAASQLSVGDLLIVMVEKSTAPKMGLMWVSSNDGTTVDVNDMTAIGGTDTD